MSVIDTQTNAVVRTVTTGLGPRHTSFSPDGREAFVTNEFDDRVEVFDTESFQSLRTVKVGRMPHFALVAGDQVFVTNFGGGNVTVLSRSKRKTLATVPVGTGSLGAGATKDGKRIYIACHNSNQVAVIDGNSHQVVARIPTGAGPVQVTVTPDQAHAYVANDGAGTVQKIDLAGNQVVKTIPIAPDAGSHGVGFAGGGRWLLITNTGAATVSVIDTDTDEVVKTIPVPKAPEGITVKR